MVKTRTEYLAPEDPTQPGLAMEVIELVDSYMIWIGVAESAEKVGEASLAGRLAGDWACGMPPQRAGVPGVGTRLFRSERNDGALSMAQRLAVRVGRQVFVCVDVPGEVMGAAERFAVTCI